MSIPPELEYSPFASLNHSHIYMKDLTPALESEEEFVIENPQTEEAAAAVVECTAVTQSVKPVDIFKHLFGTLSGKDKTFKITKYVLDLLKVHITKSRECLTDDKVIHQLGKFRGGFQYRLLFQILLRNPIQFFRIIAVLLFRDWEKHLTVLSVNIGIFRQILRFGGTGFRVRNLVLKITRFLSKIPKGDFKTIFFDTFINEQTLGDIIDLYYGVMDEAVLLFKFGIFKNAGVKRFVVKHEAISWYYDIMLGMKKAWCQLQDLQKRHLECKIQHEVRIKAAELSASLSGHKSSPIKRKLAAKIRPETSQYLSEMKNLEYQMRLVKLDVYRLCCDFIADTVDVFDIPTPPGTYALFSLFSACFGMRKIWNNSATELSKQ